MKIVSGLASFIFIVSVSAGWAQNHQAPDPKALADFAMANTGNADNGRRIFLDGNRVLCIKCHTIDGTGKLAGPDLSAIGDKFPRRELIRSILEPSSTIAVGYGTSIITTKDGEEHQGILKQAENNWVELMGMEGKTERIATGDIKGERTSPVSLMPEGLVATLKPQEFSDLVAFLESLHMRVSGQVQSPAMPEIIPQAKHDVELKPFFSADVHFKLPVWFGEVPGFTNRFVVLEHAGKSWLITRTAQGDEQSSLLDLSSEVRFGGATGLLGLAFHPHFSENHKYYLKYQVLRNDRIVTVLMERQFRPDFSGDAGVPPREVLAIEGVTQDHNGGCIAFGPDGYLYLGMGDTGPQRDPQGHAQDLSLLLGKILRIDVEHQENGRNYAIPKDNPFVGRANVRPEIWAYGFREPWRFTFDSVTGDLWVGDVGQDSFEEVTMPRAGENHGWNVYEGVTPYSDSFRQPGEKYIPPVFSYSHHKGVSITGGYVYHGEQAPLMAGRYICGDFQTQRIWALTQTDRTLTSVVEIGRSPSRFAAFGQDSAGELYIAGYDSGLIYKLDLSQVNPAPREVKVIAQTSEHEPVLWRYTIQSPASGWENAAFDDSPWKISSGGFGTQGTPGAIVRSEWRTGDIWLRREFDYANSIRDSKLGSLILRIHHDEDVEVYLNGVEIAHEPHWTSGYVELPLSKAGDALRNGRNLLAIHCHQNTGGQYIDAGLFEAEGD